MAINCLIAIVDDVGNRDGLDDDIERENVIDASAGFEVNPDRCVWLDQVFLVLLQEGKLVFDLHHLETAIRFLFLLRDGRGNRIFSFHL